MKIFESTYNVHPGDESSSRSPISKCLIVIWPVEIIIFGGLLISYYEYVKMHPREIGGNGTQGNQGACVTQVRLHKKQHSFYS